MQRSLRITQLACIIENFEWVDDHFQDIVTFMSAARWCNQTE